MSTTPVTFKFDLNDKAKILIARLGDRPGLGSAIAGAIDMENVNTVAAIKTKLRVAGKSKRGTDESNTGNYLFPHRITGRLQMSIGSTKSIVELGASSRPVVRSAVGSGVGQGSNAVKYAAAQEYGATITISSRPRQHFGSKIMPKSSRYNNLSGQFTKAYTITIPARAYVTPTVKERAPRYSQRVSQNIIRYLTNQGN